MDPRGADNAVCGAGQYQRQRVKAAAKSAPSANTGDDGFLPICIIAADKCLNCTSGNMIYCGRPRARSVELGSTKLKWASSCKNCTIGKYLSDDGSSLICIIVQTSA